MAAMDELSPYCAKCGALNASGAVTCFACGESLLAPSEISAAAAASMTGKLTAILPLRSQLLRGRYRLMRCIGEGGFGAVYQAEDSELGNRRVAIKEMTQHGLSPEELQEATEAFRREALLLAGLSHPSLPRIHDHFSEDGHWYLVMEFIEGQTLETYVAKRGGRLAVAKALELSIKLCNVLEYLHTRQPPIVFRDLKPGNVMLTPEDQIFLIDFGIARNFTPGKDHDTIAFGSPGYAAPEQYGKAQTTPRSDVFSLGALLHHLLTGDDPSATPFRFKPLLLPRPAGTWTLIRHMVELDEYKRPATISIVRQELERLAAAWAEGRQTGVTATGYLGPATGAHPAVRPASWSTGQYQAVVPPRPATSAYPTTTFANPPTIGAYQRAMPPAIPQPAMMQAPTGAPVAQRRQSAGLSRASIGCLMVMLMLVILAFIILIAQAASFHP